MIELDALKTKAAACYSRCHDYKCVRTGWCTGAAGHALDDFQRKQEEKKKEEREYQAFKKLMDRYNAEREAARPGGSNERS